ncbi:hypothetical protein SAMN05216289_1441, partial [Dokdonella immobilis]
QSRRGAGAHLQRRLISPVGCQGGLEQCRRQIGLARGFTAPLRCDRSSGPAAESSLASIPPQPSAQALPVHRHVESGVFEHFRALSTNRIVILISHRFSTVRMADQIIVIQDGRIIEHGNHAQLLRQGGHYAHLFSLQAAGYQ